MDPQTRYLLLADLVLVVHFLFVLFVVLGGLLVWRWRRLAGLHLPALAWGLYIQFSGAICPLTPLEIRLRRLAGAEAWEGGFIAHYLVPLIYPPGLTPEMQWWLGLGLLALNGGVYALLLAQRCRHRRKARR